MDLTNWLDTPRINIDFRENYGTKLLVGPPGGRPSFKLEPKKLQELRMLLDRTFSKIPSVTPYGGMKLKGGGTANGPMRPELASRD